jgi:cobyrinic acid a,c-diamide synthase
MTARLVIAGTHSGVGKTTITVGLIDALRRRGLRVQPFKVGPDYIDPGYHTLAAGRPCRNLDTWMLPPERVQAMFAQAAASADVALIEGVMGLFDGSGYTDESGSTAEVAKLLDAPVVLVLDAARMARSAGAIALGYQRFDRHLPLAGFLVNRAAGENHGRGVVIAIEAATSLPVFGWLPRAERLEIPERQLGLIPTSESAQSREFTRAAGDLVSQRLDLDRLQSLTNSRREQAVNPTFRTEEANPYRPIIAVARDEAFHFTYEDNLDLLRASGGELVSFSPLRDQTLPAGAAGVVLSGGFPEVFAEQLASNRAMQAALREAHDHGLPLYAECGGLMYLTQAIRDGAGNTFPMVGLLPGHCEMADSLTMGYRIAQSAGESWFLHPGETIRGHEFHYSTWKDRPEHLPPAYYLLPRSGDGEARPEGARVGNLWASYVHVHFGAKPELTRRFVNACCLVDAAGGRR